MMKIQASYISRPHIGYRVRNQVKCRAVKNIDELKSFLEVDLQHLFDDRGIDSSVYAEKVEFEDPITKYDSIQGYLFNIRFLKLAFRPQFILHEARVTSTTEVTTRWTMIMSPPSPLPWLWSPELAFTGESMYGMDPTTGKINRHVDTWDAIRGPQSYFSQEGLMELLRQLGRLSKLDDDTMTPPRILLRRTSDYDVVKYEPFSTYEFRSDSPSAGARAFGYLEAYRKERNWNKTMPIITSQGRMLRPTPMPASSSTPMADAVFESNFPAGVYAIRSFAGYVENDVLQQQVSKLRDALRRDRIVMTPDAPTYVAQFNDAQIRPQWRTNEVWVPLQDFALWPRDRRRM